MSGDGLGSLSAVDSALLEYFKESAPFVALMLEGVWGAGKTHLLRERGPRLAARAGKKYVSLSVAGLQTRDELERALFFAASPALNNGYAEALGIFTRAAMRWVKIEPNELTPSAELSAGSVVVVLDDLERFAGSFKVVLGFVIDLVDSNGLHVVVVASDQKLMAQGEFVGEWKEKVVGRTVRVVPSHEEMLSVAIDDIANRVCAEKLATARGPLLIVLEKSELGNFRAIKHSIRELVKIVEALGSSFDELRAAQSILLEGFLIGLLEIKRDASRVQDVAEFFSHSDFGLAHQVMTMEDAEVSDASRADTFVDEVMRRYDGTSLALFPGGTAVSEFFARGVFSRDAVLPLFDGLRDQALAEEAPSILTSNVFLLSQEDFERQAAEVELALRRAEYRSVSAVTRAYVALKFCSDRRLIALTQSEVSGLCVAAIESIPAHELTDKHADTDVFWFQRQLDDNDRAVVKAVEEKVAAAYQSEAEQHRHEVLAKLSAGEGDLGDLQDGWALRALFVGEPHIWSRALLSASGAQLNDLLRLLGRRARVGGGDAYLYAELPTLRPLAALLRGISPASDVLTLVESQYCALADALDALAERLERSQSLAAELARVEREQDAQG